PFLARTVRLRTAAGSFQIRGPCQLELRQLIERADKIKQAKETNNGGAAAKKNFCQRINRRYRATSPGPAPSPPLQPEKRKDHGLMANLASDTKCRDSQRDGNSRQFRHRNEKAASETEPMKKAEEKGDNQPAAAMTAIGPANILQGNDDD